MVVAVERSPAWPPRAWRSSCGGRQIARRKTGWPGRLRDLGCISATW